MTRCPTGSPLSPPTLLYSTTSPVPPATQKVRLLCKKYWIVRNKFNITQKVSNNAKRFSFSAIRRNLYTVGKVFREQQMNHCVKRPPPLINFYIFSYIFLSLYSAPNNTPVFCSYDSIMAFCSYPVFRIPRISSCILSCIFVPMLISYLSRLY